MRGAYMVVMYSEEDMQERYEEGYCWQCASCIIQCGKQQRKPGETVTDGTT